MAERSRAKNMGWLRASVLGANDGILSTASLVLGVAAATASERSILLTGIAGLVSGALSMAAGEYVSVQSQADTEDAELDHERTELRTDNVGEHKELAAIYVARGLEPSVAKIVADELMARDPLGAHARDDLGITDTLRARPLQAAMASAASFAIGASMPVVVTLIVPRSMLVVAMFISALICLGILGALAARTGGASVVRGSVRVMVLGVLAMAVTSAIGTMLGAVT